jgi:hypothetical protein
VLGECGGDAVRVKPQAWAAARSEADGAETVGVFVDPRPGDAVASRDFRGVDEAAEWLAGEGSREVAGNLRGEGVELLGR